MDNNYYKGNEKGMTKEMIDKCSKFELQLRWAVKSNFVHMTNKEFSEIAALYKSVYGEGLTTSQMTCNTCRLKALKRLGNDYFESVQAIALKEKEERLAEMGAVIQPKKKGGRKKKIDID